MLRPLQTPEVTQRDWMESFSADFRCRFMALLPGAFRDFPPPLVLSLLAPKLTWSEAETQVGCRMPTLMSAYSLQMFKHCSKSHTLGARMAAQHTARLHSTPPQLVNGAVCTEREILSERCYQLGVLPGEHSERSGGYESRWQSALPA